MTTQAQRFAKLLQTFQPILDNYDETIYIIKIDGDSQLLFDNEGNKILCDDCNKQLHYDSGDMICENQRCKSNQ